MATLAPRTLASVATPSTLHWLRSAAALPPDSWHLVAGVTLTALNRPDDVTKVYEHALDAKQQWREHSLSLDKSLHLTRRMREGIIKSAPVIGLPKVINALIALRSATPAELLNAPDVPPPTERGDDLREKDRLPDVNRRGEDFFNQVYGKVARRVMHQLESCGCEDLSVVARLAYGHVLSNTRVLTAAETSFVLISGLIPLDVNAQLKGHLKGALNNGATVDQVRAVRKAAIRLCRAAGMKELNDDMPGGWGWRTTVSKL